MARLCASLPACKSNGCLLDPTCRRRCGTALERRSGKPRKVSRPNRGEILGTCWLLRAVVLGGMCVGSALLPHRLIAPSPTSAMATTAAAGYVRCFAASTGRRAVASRSLAARPVCAMPTRSFFGGLFGKDKREVRVVAMAGQAVAAAERRRLLVKRRGRGVAAFRPVSGRRRSAEKPRPIDC